MTLNAQGPLVGIRVLEMCEGQAGPYCGAMLSDLGADVIKIESREGDFTRKLGPFKNGESGYFISFNRGKKGMAMDFGQEKAREIVRALAAKCDIFIENLEPGVVDSLGLDYKRLSKINTSIIYGSVSCYGRTGPLSKYLGNDIVAEAMTDHTNANGQPDGPPEPMGIALCEYGGGAQLAYGLLCAYLFKMHTGHGQYVDISLVDNAISENECYLTYATMVGKKHVRNAGYSGVTGPYGVFQAMDGTYAIGTATNELWGKIARAIGRPELHTADGWATSLERSGNNWTHMMPLLNNWGKDKTRDDIVRILSDENGIPCGPSLTHKDVQRDAQYRIRGTLVDIEQPMAGKVSVASAFAGKMSDSRPAIQGPAPLLGEHNAEVLSDILGFTGEEVNELCEQGVLVEDLQPKQPD
jgi:CoA:oxalate CoA-transferase